MTRSPFPMLLLSSLRRVRVGLGIGILLGAGWNLAESLPSVALPSAAMVSDRPESAVITAIAPAQSLDPVEGDIVGLFQEFYCAYWEAGATVETATAEAYRDTYQFLQVKFNLGVHAGLSNAAQEERDRAIAAILNRLGDSLATATATCPTPPRSTPGGAHHPMPPHLVGAHRVRPTNTRNLQGNKGNQRKNQRDRTGFGESF